MALYGKMNQGKVRYVRNGQNNSFSWATAEQSSGRCENIAGTSAQPEKYKERSFFFFKKVNKNQEKCQGLSAEKGKAVICMMILLRSGQKTKKKQGMSI